MYVNCSILQYLDISLLFQAEAKHMEFNEWNKCICLFSINGCWSYLECALSAGMQASIGTIIN